MNSLIVLVVRGSPMKTRSGQPSLAMKELTLLSPCLRAIPKKLEHVVIDVVSSSLQNSNCIYKSATIE